MAEPDPEPDLLWRIGGPQGRGVDTAAVTFARVLAMAGYHLFGRREYYSNIMGRHSYYDIRAARRQLTCHRENVDLLATFEAETLARHILSVRPGGGILYNPEDAEVALERIEFLDAPVLGRLSAYLEEHHLPATTGGLLEDARRRGVNTLPLPYREIGAALREELGASAATAQLALNTVAVASSCAWLGLSADFFRRAFEIAFAGREKLLRLNMRAVELAYEAVREAHQGGFTLRLASAEAQPRLFLNGTQAVAMGKMAGGLTFQTYYPISPATDESVFLEAHEREGGLVVIQTEDELAAVTMAAGAALTGARSATATSGPGFSLMAEGLSWAGANEVPLVVTIWQRGGPSTGMPTRNEQGDLHFALHAGHGEFPRIVLSSGDVEEAFYDAAAAFNYAERYETVVIHLLDKALASSTRTVEPFDVSAIRIDRGLLFDGAPGDAAGQGLPAANGKSAFQRFKPTPSGISPRAVLGQPGGTHWLTGGEHTALGRVTEDPTVREEQMEKRMRKLRQVLRDLSPEEKLKVYGEPGAALTLLSWGSNKGALLEALQRLSADGTPARFVQVRLLSPFPADEVREALAGAKPLVVVESNYSGQLASLLREHTGLACDYLVVKYNGRPMSGGEVYRALRDIRAGTAEARTVLRNPWE